MRDVGYNDLIDELKMLSTEVTAGTGLTESKAPKVYAALDVMANSPPVIEAIRYGRPSKRSWIPLTAVLGKSSMVTLSCLSVKSGRSLQNACGTVLSTSPDVCHWTMFIRNSRNSSSTR